MALRIASLYLLATLGLLILLGGGVYFSTESALLDARRDDLQAGADSVAGLLQVAVRTQDELRLLAPALAGTIALGGSGRTLRIFSASGVLLATVPPPRDDRNSDRPSAATTQLFPPTLIGLAIVPEDTPGMIYAAAAVPGTNNSGTSTTIGVVEVMQSRGDIDAILNRLRTAFGVAGLAAVVLALLIGSLLARSVTAPVRRLQGVAAAIAAGELHRRATDLPNNEIGALGDSFNIMSARLGSLLSISRGEQRRLSAILSSLADGVLACDKEGKLLLHNPAAREILGANVTATEEMLDEIIATTEIRQLWRRAMGAEPAGLKPGPVEQEMQLAGRAILVVATPIYSPTPQNSAEPVNSEDLSPALRPLSPVSGCVAVLRDMTRVRELEQVRGNLLRRLGHELRTPLTALVATVDNMRDTASPTQEEAMATVVNEALRLSRLVDELMALSRGSDGRLIQPRPVELVSLAASVCSLFERRAERLGIELLVPGGDHAIVRGDPDRLRQVLVNLLDNALRYVQPGGHIEVRVRSEGSDAVVVVIDDGPGMDEETARWAFEPYQQGAPPNGNGEITPRGSGLGLAIVREIVQSHGGRVSLDTAPGRGVTIYVRLPLSAMQ